VHHRSRHVVAPAVFAVALLAVIDERATPLRAQTRAPPAPASTDAELYANACANCHGLDGAGSVEVSALLGMPLPDFSECTFATREPDADWGAIAHAGGPIRGFAEEMPAFGDALPEADLARTLRHVRTFCPDRAWPRGELNLPRALVTEKAYPEDEAVWSTSVAASGPGAIINEIVYEKRFGARNQFELKVPLELAEHAGGDWRFGAGDVALGVKRALAHDLDRGYIVSAAAELILPTGDESAGAGSGVTTFEPFVSFGQILPSDSFLHAQAGLELPSNTDTAEREAFWRLVAGRTWTQGPLGFGRAWSPMVELLGSRALVDDATTHWDVVPQVQVTLNTRQHVMLNAGFRVPVNDRSGRSTRFMVYLLWDWFDGGLFDGW
jgi:mono/diheme cytochrome c family protein